MTSYGDIDIGQHLTRYCDDLLLDGAKPIPESTLTYFRRVLRHSPNGNDTRKSNKSNHYKWSENYTLKIEIVCPMLSEKYVAIDSVKEFIM